MIYRICDEVLGLIWMRSR